MPEVRRRSSRIEGGFRRKMSRFSETRRIRRTERVYEKTAREIEKRIGGLPKHSIVIGSRREIALFSNSRMPLSQAVREGKVAKFEKLMKTKKPAKLVGATMSKEEVIAHLDKYLQVGKDAELRRLAKNLKEKVKKVDTENVILLGAISPFNKKALKEQVAHEIGHLTLNEIAGRKIDTSSMKNKELHEGFATLFGVGIARPRLLKRLKDRNIIEKGLRKMGYPDIYISGAVKWGREIDKNETDILRGLVKAAKKKFK